MQNKQSLLLEENREVKLQHASQQFWSSAPPQVPWAVTDGPCDRGMGAVSTGEERTLPVWGFIWFAVPLTLFLWILTSLNDMEMNSPFLESFGVSLILLFSTCLWSTVMKQRVWVTEEPGLIRLLFKRMSTFWLSCAIYFCNGDLDSCPLCGSAEAPQRPSTQDRGDCY